MSTLKTRALIKRGGFLTHVWGKGIRLQIHNRLGLLATRMHAHTASQGQGQGQSRSRLRPRTVRGDCPRTRPSTMPIIRGQGQGQGRSSEDKAKDKAGLALARNQLPT